MTEDFSPKELRIMGLDALRSSIRFHLLDCIKHPIANFARVRRKPRVVVQFVRRLMRAR